MAETAYPNDAGPIVDPNTLEFRRAITSVEMGYSVISRLKQDSWYRNEKQAAIMRKYNDEPPYQQNKLDAANQGWRRNASTGFLSSMIKRILPSYNQVVDKAQYLTASRFPTSDVQIPDVQQKQTDFQLEVTKTIRSWSGWQAFKSQVILENLLFGFSGAGWTDEITWEPRFLRQDEAYFPDGCGQEAKKVPLWCLDQAFQIHEMAEYLINPEASAAAGWDIDNIVIAINDSKPENRLSGTNPDVRKYQDLIRETSLGCSYSTGVKIIKATHLFVQEVSGKVSHYIYDDRTKNLLFCRLDRYENMEQNLSLMAVEVGNGKLHGSKGVGRVLYNTHVSVEQARNLMADNLMLSGLLVLTQGDNAKPAEALKVVHPVAILGKGFEVSQKSFTPNWEAFKAMDDMWVQIAEVMIGAFMPGQQQQNGDPRTASEVNYVASIEQELKEGNLARFYQQFQLIIWECQKRICSIDNIKKAQAIYAKEKSGMVKMFTQKMVNLIKSLGEMITGEFEISTEDTLADDAVKCCLALLRKNLTPKDIYVLGQAPSFDLTTDTAQDLTAAWAAIKASMTGNPNVDQVELDKRYVSSIIGARNAEELIIPAEDNTLATEATRTQLTELMLIMQGEQVKISPRDFDPVHLKVIMDKAMAIMKNPQAIPPEIIPNLGLLLQHFEMHLQAAQQKAGSQEGLQEFIAFDKQAQQFLGDAEAAAQAAPQTPAMDPSVLPVALQATGGASAPMGYAGPEQSPAVLANPTQAIQDKPLSRGPVAPVY